jgi:hypothetical protein
MNSTNPTKTTLENLKKVVFDFTTDLTLTFPEYGFLWEKWTRNDISEVEIKSLMDYCLAVYPERFFDILYQNDEIFAMTSDINVFFLPNVDFKLLFHCTGVTENTRKTMWKYIQLVMFTIVNNVTDKSKFGENGNIFEGVEEDELRSKLDDAMKGIGEFFQKMSEESGDTTEGSKENPFTFDKMDGMPNVDEMHSHLKGLFDGKIGKLAKELAEEITHDLGNIMDDDDGSVKTTQDVFQKMMKNPTKMMDLLKIVNTKLTSKMQSGDISEEDIMKEAGDIIGRMKEMGGAGGADFQDMLRGMMKNMGGLGGLAAAMGGKGAKVDVNAMNRMSQNMATKDRLRQKLAAKQASIAAGTPAPASLHDSLFPTDIPNNLVFSLPEKQEQTPIGLKPSPQIESTPLASAPKKSKKKKGKK